MWSTWEVVYGNEINIPSKTKTTRQEEFELEQNDNFSWILFTLVSVAFTKTLIFVNAIETSEHVINVLVINVSHGDRWS